MKGDKWQGQPLTKGITETITNERKMAQDPDGWLFPSPRTKSGHIEQLSEAFSRCVKTAGMEPAVVVPHTMRHTAISRLAVSGADIKTLQEFSGHESMVMVLRYAHAQDRAVNQALDRMEGGTIVELPAGSQAQKS